MNVYDFDKTIFKKDSTLEFYKFCLKRYKKVKWVIFKQIKAYILYLFKKIDKTCMKERFYVFLQYVPDVDASLMEFWLTNKTGFNSWYFNKRRGDDIIITASPRFIVEPAVKMLGLSRLIASEVDKRTGKYTGFNCRGKEKVRRLKKEYNVNKIGEFYSDSRSDEPLAKMAEKAYLVKGERLFPWKFKRGKNV